MTTADLTEHRFVRDRTTLFLYAALGVFGALQVVPGLVAPALRDEFGYGYTLTSLHLSLFAVLGLLSGIAGPWLDRRLGRRTVLLLGVAGMSVAVAAVTVGQVAAATLAAVGVAGLLGTLIVLTVQAALADHHGDRRAVAFAESNVIASVGSTSAPLAVGAAAAALGSWRWGVLALAVGGVAVALCSRGTRVPSMAEVVDADAVPGGRLPGAARTGVALLFTGVTLEWGVGYWGATYLREEVDLSRSTAVTAMTGFFAAMLVGRALGGWLVRTVDAARLVGAGQATVAAGLVLHAATTSAPVALAGLVLLGLGIAVLFPLSLALAVGAAPDRAALVSSRCIVAGSTAVLLGPLVVGQLADRVGLRPAMLVLPVVTVAGALLLARLVRQR